MFRKMACVAERVAVGSGARQRIRIQIIKRHICHDDKLVVRPLRRNFQPESEMSRFPRQKAHSSSNEEGGTERRKPEGNCNDPK